MILVHETSFNILIHFPSRKRFKIIQNIIHIQEIQDTIHPHSSYHILLHPHNIMLKSNIFMYYLLIVQRTIHIFTPYLYQTFYGKQYFVNFLDW